MVAILTIKSANKFIFFYYCLLVELNLEIDHLGFRTVLETLANEHCGAYRNHFLPLDFTSLHGNAANWKEGIIIQQEYSLCFSKKEGP